MSSDKNSNLSRRRRSLSLNKVILGVIMVAFILLYVSIDNFYATHTSLHGEDNAARILKLSSVDVASDTIVANPTVHIVDGDKLRGQVYGQVSSQIKPLQNEVKALQTNINELVQLLQESKGANNEKVREIPIFIQCAPLNIAIMGSNLIIFALKSLSTHMITRRLINL